MNSMKTFAAAMLLAALSAGAYAGSNNGADGWHKLQEVQQGATPTTQPSADQRASADNYAAQAIAANPSNYSTH